jgi:hypothetical protein
MKKMKVILPALAIAFGITGALATNTTPSRSLDEIEVTETAGVCIATGYCDTLSEDETCLTGLPVFIIDSPGCASPQTEGEYIPG